MELSDLLTFSTVARLGGITRAADELNTVQSNVTQRVKALEAEIGTALFERHSRGMTLTGAGRRLLPYAQRMAALSREAVLAARDDGEPKGPLAIGSMETTAAVRLPALLAEFHRRFPAVRLTLRTVDDGGPGGRPCSTAHSTAPSSPVRSSMPNSPRRSPSGKNWCCVTARRWNKPRRVARGHAGIRPHRAGVPHRLHLPAAARTGVFGIRLAVRRAL